MESTRAKLLHILTESLLGDTLAAEYLLLHLISKVNDVKGAKNLQSSMTLHAKKTVYYLQRYPLNLYLINNVKAIVVFLG